MLMVKKDIPVQMHAKMNQQTKQRNVNTEEVFDPEVLDCCIDIGDCHLENPPDELIKLLTGKPISECEKIIKEFLNPKEKLVIKWPRKIRFRIPDDNR